MLTTEQIDNFTKYFRVEFVNTEQQRLDMQHLRYEVYIEEFGFDDVAKFPDMLEYDEYDDFASACIIYHIPTNTPAACVRLIPALECSQLPVEKYIAHSLDKSIMVSLNADRSNLGEISRLAVSKKFRRRPKESLSPAGWSTGEERSYPLLSVACFMACIILADVLHIENNIASMEPFLPRLIQRSGPKFTEIGSLVEYHGARSTYLVYKQEVLDNLSEVCKQFLADIEADVLQQIMCIY